jgi:4-diphosphocytidyl-2-C-methyl-D-erythritol kinase
MISAMRVRAFAKINLSLRVLGRRADGYHELRTTFQSIALHDTLTIRPARGPFHMTCDDPDCPDGDANLIWRAAEEVWRAAGRRGAPRDVAVDLRKRIPVQAGLGGGSSDAAAALRAFGRLWRVDAARLRAIGPELGADVPFFFEGGTVLGLERGDLLFPLIDRPAAWVVLALPNFGVSTGDAFAWLDEEVAPRRQPKARRDLMNDLEAPVAARHPEIRRIVNALRKAGGEQAAMTGSGSTVFGLFRSRTAASTAARALAARSRRTVITRTLNRSQYQRLAAL